MFFTSHPAAATTGAVLGGPTVEAAASNSAEPFLVASNFPDDLAIAVSQTGTAGFIFLDEAAFIESGSPLAANLPSRDGLLTYKVQKGDTLSSIAASFGISLNSIIWANRDLRATALKVGQAIVILPVSGVLYKVDREKDTAQSVAALFGVAVERIFKYNKNVTLAAINQDTLIIPDARPQTGVALSLGGNLPEYPGYYVIPTTGWNWGELHDGQSIDIANARGTQIYAAASGLVTEGTGYGYNSGYGNRVMIEHPNGTKTLYGHLEKISVSVGDYVAQGDPIGTIGHSGNVLALGGGEGDHLHFKIIGAKNPFAKK